MRASPQLLGCAALLIQQHPKYMRDLKLHALLYFAQVECLTRHGRPVFPDRIVARSTGPFIPALWRALTL